MGGGDPKKKWCSLTFSPCPSCFQGQSPELLQYPAPTRLLKIWKQAASDLMLKNISQTKVDELTMVHNNDIFWKYFLQ